MSLSKMCEIPRPIDLAQGGLQEKVCHAGPSIALRINSARHRSSRALLSKAVVIENWASAQLLSIICKLYRHEVLHCLLKSHCFKGVKLFLRRLMSRHGCCSSLTTKFGKARGLAPCGNNRSTLPGAANPQRRIANFVSGAVEREGRLSCVLFDKLNLIENPPHIRAHCKFHLWPQRETAGRMQL